METEQKPFACGIENCDMSFTNEDHLNVHRKKHDMVLNLGLNAAKCSVFLADQTPTPTRLIRNCDEVGLFDDIAVNPFEETFRRAVESKDDHIDQSLGPLSMTGDDTLHTPYVMPYFNATPENKTNDHHTTASSTLKVDHISLHISDVRRSMEDFGNEKLIADNGGIDLNLSQSTTTVASDNSNTNDQSQELIISTHVVSQAPTDVTRASVIYVPQLASAVQSVSAVLKETTPKKLRSILPTPQTRSEQQRSNTTAQSQNVPNVGEPIMSTTRNLVKEKLKEALLKIKASSSVPSSRNDQTNNNYTNGQPVKYDQVISGLRNEKTSTAITNKFDTTSTASKTAHLNEQNRSPVQSDTNYEKNRAAAAAKRYRIKFKNEHNNLKRKNAQLELENERLRSELRAVKTILLAHHDCSVTRAMTLGNVCSLGNSTEIKHKPTEYVRTDEICTARFCYIGKNHITLLLIEET